MTDPTGPARIEDLLAHAEWLRALARRLVGSDEAASDAEQETWLAAIEHPPRDASAPRKWLAQVLRNIVHEQRRSEGARRAREARAARPEAVAGGEEVVDRAQSLRALIEAVLELDEPYRTTLLQRYQEGLSTEAIASRDGVPPSTVRNRLSRGHAQLRERLERSHGSAWSGLLVPLLRLDAPHIGAATAGGGSLGASLVALTSMATIKLVSAAALVLAAGGALWWRLSDRTPEIPRTTVAPSEDRASPLLADPLLAATPTRAVVDAPRDGNSPLDPDQVGKRGSLLVRVTWESDGTPASDVAVQVHPWGESSSFAFETSLPTDAQGCARFPDLASGLASVVIDRADGEMVQVRGGEQVEVALRIPRGMLVRGRVVDLAGEPVGFARIWLSQYGNRGHGDEVATADGLGRFTLRDVGDGRYIAARAAGFGPSLSSRLDGQPGDQIEVQLEMLPGGGELRGVVRAPDGSTVPDAAVLIGHEGASVKFAKDGSQRYSPPPQRLRTDEHGEFAATGIASGRTNVECRASSFAPFARGFEIVSESPTSIAVELQPGAAVAGVVLGADGKPASKVRVGVGDYGSFGSSNATTASDGSFRMEGLATGGTKIRFAADARGDANASMVLTAGETARIDVQLVKRGMVAGQVVDEQGKPLVGWHVAAVSTSHHGLQLRSSDTDGEGKFELDNWPEKANAIAVREAERRIAPPNLLVVSPEIGRIDLVLVVPAAAMFSASISGRLLGPQGEIVKDSVFLWGERGANQKYHAELSTSTGEFRVELQPGFYELQAQSLTMGKLELPQIQVRAGEEVDLGVIRFAAPGRVRIRIVGPAESLANLEAKSIAVTVLGPGRHLIGPVELDGKLEGLSMPLSAGPYVIEVASGAMRSSPTPVAVVAGEELEVEIALARATSRSFNLIWAPDVPPKELFDFVVTEASGRVFLEAKLPAEEKGPTHIGLPGLVIGTYWVDVKTTDGRSARISFTVDDFTPAHEQRSLRGGIDIPIGAR